MDEPSMRRSIHYSLEFCGSVNDLCRALRDIETKFLPPCIRKNVRTPINFWMKFLRFHSEIIVCLIEILVSRAAISLTASAKSMHI